MNTLYNMELKQIFETETRTCAHCEISKPLTEFYDKFLQFKRFMGRELCTHCVKCYFRLCYRCNKWFNWAIYKCPHMTVCARHWKINKPQKCDCTWRT